MVSIAWDRVTLQGAVFRQLDEVAILGSQGTEACLMMQETINESKHKGH